jgi:hypothetical protein
MTTAAALTYDSLITDLQTYLERSDANLISQLPRFIMLAESKLATRCRGLGYLKVVTGTMTISDPILVKPARWRETSSLWYTVGGKPKYMKSRAYEYCRIYGGDAGLSAPEFYADYGYERFLLAGTPDQAYPFELAYFERPEPLSSSNQTNWTTQYAPQLMLFSALCEAAVWLKLADKAAEYKTYFEEAMQAVAAEAELRVADMAMTRKAQ